MNQPRAWDRAWGRGYIAVSKMDSTSALTTARNFVRAAHLRPGSRLLDVGAGHGRVTDLIVRQVPDLDVTAIDLTWDLLTSFVVQPGANGCTLHLTQVDLGTAGVPFRPAVFDAVVSSRVFQYLADPLAVLRDLSRVLRPGGWAVVSVPNRFNPVKYLTYRRAELYSPGEVGSWFRKCGFLDVTVRSMCFFPSTRKFRRAARIAEKASVVPLVKLLGGSTLVWGRMPSAKRASGDP